MEEGVLILTLLFKKTLLQVSSLVEFTASMREPYATVSMLTRRQLSRGTRAPGHKAANVPNHGHPCSKYRARITPLGLGPSGF